MAKTGIEPHKITRPFQLLATWMAGLVLLVSALLTAAQYLKQPAWLPAFLAVSAVALVVVFAVLIFLMQTKFRPQLQDDPHYLQWQKHNAEVFGNFSPENVAANANSNTLNSSESFEEWEIRRSDRYTASRGLFLVHEWRPSFDPSQVADVTIRLHQHRDGPLTKGQVKSVEYILGPKFFQKPMVKTNADESFRLNVSAYGPMLVLAKVQFSDGTPPLELERYINF